MTNNPQLVNQLLAASIHEIKNRFGLMFSQLDLLLAQVDLQPEQLHGADLVKSEADFIGSELVRVLATYKALEGQNVINQQQQFLEDFLEEKVARHASTSRAHNITMDFQCNEDLDGFFDGAVVNIAMDTAIYNAVKEGASQILLSADMELGYLSIQIHDNGPGFPAAMLESPIQAGELKQDSASTGLGLYFAQSLISQHQEQDKTGKVLLKNSPVLGGACVNLLLPQ